MPSLLPHPSSTHSLPRPTRAPSNATLGERLARRTVVVSSGCWEFAGARNRDGYGVLAFKALFGRSMRPAHRIAWELACGPIPDGLYVCHHCDNPPCVNPAHLFLGTAADNAHDRDAKGRTRPNPFKPGDPSNPGVRFKPGNHGNTRGALIPISRTDARALRATGLAYSAIAARLGCSKNHAWRLAKGA